MKDVTGLKKLRKQNGKKPTYHCDNCGCDRYTICTCVKKS